jgi:hypothetical protein
LSAIEIGEAAHKSNQREIEQKEAKVTKGIGIGFKASPF